MYRCILCKKELFSNFKTALCKDCHKTLLSYLRLEIINKYNYKIYILFFYEGEIKKLIRLFKFHDNTYIAKIFSIFLIKAIKDAKISFNYISYVPMYKIKKIIRGYDQSQLLAKFIATELNIKCIDLISRKKNTKSLYKLNKKERAEELKDAFILKNNKNNILIIDDIYTTGTTINEISKTLEKNNIKNYNFLVLA